ALHGETSHDRDDHLVSRFDTLASSIREIITLDPALGAPLIEGLPYLRAEAVYCARHELVVTLEDVLSRRLRGLLYDRHATEAAAESTARLIAPELGWDELRINAEVQKFSEICAHEVAAARA
ncbi:MAG: glycerol-3-phosphate dehydrogenase C-terminal domain-containing protein, partial [Ilumatobacteraceae bacterium]